MHTWVAIEGPEVVLGISGCRAGVHGHGMSVRCRHGAWVAEQGQEAVAGAWLKAALDKVDVVLVNVLVRMSSVSQWHGR